MDDEKQEYEAEGDEDLTATPQKAPAPGAAAEGAVPDDGHGGREGHEGHAHGAPPERDRRAR
jgi:hypothetical protein